MNRLIVYSFGAEQLFTDELAVQTPIEKFNIAVMDSIW